MHDVLPNGVVNYNLLPQRSHICPMTAAVAAEEDVYLPGVLHHYCPLLDRLAIQDNASAIDMGQQPSAPSVLR